MFCVFSVSFFLLLWACDLHATHTCKWQLAGFIFLPPPLYRSQGSNSGLKACMASTLSHWASLLNPCFSVLILLFLKLYVFCAWVCTCHSVHVEVRGQVTAIASLLMSCRPQGWAQIVRLGSSAFTRCFISPGLQPTLPPPLHFCVLGVHLNMFFMDVGRCKGLHCSSFIVTEAEKLRYCSLANELALGIPSLCPPAGIRGIPLWPTWVLEIWNLVLVLERHASPLQPCSFLKLCNHCASEGLLSSPCFLSYLFFLFGLLLLLDICSEFW